MNQKPISNLRKLKYIEKAAQRDWARRHEIRAAGLRALGFYSEPFLYPWFNPVKILYGMLLQVKPKRRAAIFRVARAAMKKGLMVKIQSLMHPHWKGETYGLPSILERNSSAFPAKFLQRIDLRKLKFSTPEQDKVDEDIDSIVKFIQDKVNKLGQDEKWKVLEAVYNWVGQQEV